MNLDGSIGSVHSRYIDQTVGIIINPINDALVQDGSNTLSGQAREDEPYTIHANELLSGITDVDEGDTLAITGAVVADHGAIVSNQDGTYTFTPDTDYNGTVTFSFIVADGNGGSVNATQSLIITSVNDDPRRTTGNLDNLVIDEDTDPISLGRISHIYTRAY